MTKFRIGNLEVTRVEDFVDHGVPLKMVLPEVTEETIAANRGWLQPNFLDANGATISVHIQSWLFRTKHHTILVDSCVGHQKRRHFPPFNMRTSVFLDNLNAAGTAAGRGRLRLLHASAQRSRRLEHEARERPLGPDFPEGEISVLAQRL